MIGQQIYQAQQDLAQMEEDSPFRFAQVKLVAAAQASVGGPVYRIPAANLPYLKDQIEKKVNKRAAKLSLPSVDLIELEQEIIEHERINHETGERYTQKSIWQYVAIKGETPMIAGYNFIATLQHEEHGNIIRQIPVLRKNGEEVVLPNLNSYRHCDPECDQCGKRRHRKDTYLIWKQEDDSIMQVGSNCLGDFLGSADPQRYASYAEYLRDFLDNLSDYEDEDGEGRYYGERVETAFEMHDFLASTACMIRANGWVPASQADEFHTATSSQAFQNCQDYGKYDRDGRTPLWLDVEGQDIVLADLVLAWVRDENMGKADDDLDDYEWNLVTALRSVGVTYRTKGIVASAVSAYSRAKERELRYAKQREQAAKSEHVGTVGKREDFALTLVRTVWVENRYASRYDDDQTKPLYIFNDAEGNEVKWFASSDQGFEQGETYTLKATVKAHDDNDKFGKSTLITRAKVVA